MNGLRPPCFFLAAPRMSSYQQLLLLAVDAEVVMDCGNRTTCRYGEMKVFVYHEVVSRTLTDDPEIVYKGLIELAITERSFKVILGHASGLISITAIQANAGNALRLEMSLAADAVA